MQTLNQIVQQLRLFAADHKQLNSFRFNNIAEIGEEAAVYNLLHVSLSDPGAYVDRQVGSFFLDFEVLARPNVSNEFTSTLESLSDTHSIATDVVAFMDRNDFGFFVTIDLPVNMSPITQGEHDVVSGWRFTLKVNFDNGLNICQIPLRSYDLEEFRITEDGITRITEDNIERILE